MAHCICISLGLVVAKCKCRNVYSHSTFIDQHSNRAVTFKKCYEPRGYNASIMESLENFWEIPESILGKILNIFD